MRSLNQPSWNLWLAHVVGDEASQALTLDRRTTELWLTGETGQQGHPVQYELCWEFMLDSVHIIARPIMISIFERVKKNLIVIYQPILIFCYEDKQTFWPPWMCLLKTNICTEWNILQWNNKTCQCSLVDELCDWVTLFKWPISLAFLFCSFLLFIWHNIRRYLYNCLHWSTWPMYWLGELHYL